LAFICRVDNRLKEIKMYLEEKALGEGPSLQGLYNFAKDQYPSLEYQWDNAHICACAKYAEKIGQTDEWHHRAYGGGIVWNQLNNIAGYEPRTYGGLAKRIKELLPVE
jgi:hypothetical protein